MNRIYPGNRDWEELFARPNRLQEVVTRLIEVPLYQLSIAIREDAVGLLMHPQPRNLDNIITTIVVALPFRRPFSRCPVATLVKYGLCNCAAIAVVREIGCETRNRDIWCYSEKRIPPLALFPETN